MPQASYEVCVIGSGPAGMIVALEYARLNPADKIVLIEYGRPNQSSKNRLDDSIEVNNVINHHTPYEITNKGLGGTSATWGGRCVLFDEVDFVPRPVIGDACTWDVRLFEEMTDYLPQTSAYFECGSDLFNLNDISELKGSTIAEGFKEGIVTDSVVERWSMPTRFGVRYRKEIEACRNLTLLEGFEARDFGSPDKDGKVNSLSIREVDTQELQEIKAHAFVIAAGVQESTRILLRNTQLFSNLGFVPPALGKYYQSHLSGKIASVRFNGDSKKTDFGFLRDKEGIYVRRRFQFDSQYLIENNLLNTAIWLDNPLYVDPAHKSGAMSLMYLSMITPILGKKLAPPAIAHSITKGKVTGISKHLQNIVRDFPASLLTPASIFYKRYLLKRKLPGVFLFNPKNTYALHFHAEQIPVSSNRMELGKDGETLVIQYELTDEDVASVIKLHEVLDAYLRKMDCGQLVYWFPKEELADVIKSTSKDGIHQSGTTRIADSPSKGVVDRDLKLWGTKNVFVCSSSVFPTSSQANPTYFLGAFAVRMANHLTKKNANG